MARNYSHQNTNAVRSAYNWYLRTQKGSDADREIALDRFYQACTSLTHNQKAALVARIRNEVRK